MLWKTQLKFNEVHGKASWLIAVVSFTGLSACTQTLSKPQITCAHIDWYEVGRADGLQGHRFEKISEHQKRCDNSPHPVSVDLYTNGRELGLTEFCTPTGGVAAGRTGLSYNGVCPFHLEKAFLTNFEIGKRIRALESENADLDSKLSVLFTQPGPVTIENTSIKTQIDQLKKRRAQIDQEIMTLELNAQPN